MDSRIPRWETEMYCLRSTRTAGSRALAWISAKEREPGVRVDYVASMLFLADRGPGNVSSATRLCRGSVRLGLLRSF